MLKISGLITVLALSFMTVMMASTAAEAKRLGGGKSFGNVNKTPAFSREAKPFSSPAKQAAPVAGAAAAGTAAAGSRGMMGPIMGLAAGGLLAAMFMGGAFEGIQIFDILLIAALVLGLVMFLKSRRRANQPVASGGAGTWQREEPEPKSANSYERSAPVSATPQGETSSGGGFSIPEIGAGLKNEELSFTPVWFNEPEFMAEVENHYRQLQEHWDAGSMDTIAEYVTPEMLASLKEQRDALDSAPHTEVLQVHAQLLDVMDEGEYVVAAILFSGLVNEDRSASATQFAEVWHVQHPKDSAEGDWHLAGIQQHEI